VRVRTGEAAGVLGLSIAWIRRARHDGQLTGSKVRGELRFDPAMVEALRLERSRKTA
jgi:hypothetical protein